MKTEKTKSPELEKLARQGRVFSIILWAIVVLDIVLLVLVIKRIFEVLFI